jgi:hypothetical protein
MTHEEEKLVLKWLRGRAPPTYAHALLQRALWGDEKLSRPIREALADWIINQQISPGGLFGNGELAPLTEVGKQNYDERSAKLQARINANPDIQAHIDAHRADAKHQAHHVTSATITGGHSVTVVPPAKPDPLL